VYIYIAIIDIKLITSVYRKKSNIIRTIFTTNRGLVARVHIIHVN